MTRFLDVVMPDQFVLEYLDQDGEWIDHGLFEADQFARLDDGTYLCAGHGGTPVYLRCVRQDGPVIYSLDGAGDPYAYRLHPFPSGKYS